MILIFEEIKEKNILSTNVRAEEKQMISNCHLFVWIRKFIFLHDSKKEKFNYSEKNKQIF